MDPDTTRRQGGGKSPTKFMERPETRKAADPEPAEITSDDVDALEDQETQDLGDAPQKEGWPTEPGKPQGNPKKDPLKAQEPKKKDASSGDTGDCAC